MIMTHVTWQINNIYIHIYIYYLYMYIYHNLHTALHKWYNKIILINNTTKLTKLDKYSTYTYLQIYVIYLLLLNNIYYIYINAYKNLSNWSIMTPPAHTKKTTRSCQLWPGEMTLISLLAHPSKSLNKQSKRLCQLGQDPFNWNNVFPFLTLWAD